MFINKKKLNTQYKQSMKNMQILISDKTKIDITGITVKNFSNPWTLAGTQILQVWALFKSTS